MTRQLLAFSRQQYLQPQLVDLSKLTRDLTPVFEKLLGKNIELTMKSGNSACFTKADPSQIEQVLASLVENARDAMPEGGRLTVVTQPVLLEEDIRSDHPEVSPGEYVRITVQDSGVGMTEETKERVFDPFYTTKLAGEGVGMGLSAAYGTVKQSGGHVWVETEIGKGTTFEIHLPRHVESTV